MTLNSVVFRVVLAATMLNASIGAAQRNRDLITAEQVRTSIDRGVVYLRRQQKPRGNWPEMLGYEGGVTALCTLAMLNSGVPPDDPAIQKSLSFLRGIEPHRTYVVSLQTMALAAAGDNRDRVQIQRNVMWLESRQLDAGDMKGAWDYGDGEQGGGDNSNAQFAVLALHEAERSGAEVSLQTWARAHDYWKRTQNVDGSWGYKPGGPGTGSMTCAGIGAMLITSSKVNAGDARIDGERIACCGGVGGEDSVDRGFRWLARRFSVRGNPTPRGAASRWHYYFLYGVERVGRLSGRRFIGDHDWYREGAEYLVLKAKEPFQEAWTGEQHAEQRPEIATAMSLLFLSKGRRPVVMAQLRHGADTDWNQHRRGMANLTAFTESVWGIDLTWQVFDAGTATTEDLLQAPVLFISGSKRPDLGQQGNKLRDYIDRGGFIFAEACCEDGSGFEDGFRKLMARVFPEPEYKLRRLEPDHPIWRAEHRVRPESPYVGRLWSVEYGCRTCVVLSERDLSCRWELNRMTRVDNFPAGVKEQIGDALAIGINVLTYATNRAPRHKEDLFALAAAAGDVEQLKGRGVIRVAKLRHGGGCDDAPGALANLLRAAEQGEARLVVHGEPEPIAINESSLREFPVVFMHGRNRFRLTPAERQALGAYLQRGGTLMADSICASEAFTTAFRNEIREVLPADTLETIPTDDLLMTPDLGGFDIRKVGRRDPQAAAGEPLAARTRQVAPELEGVRLDGRWAVVFSRYDLSCALEQHDSLQCRGYTREDAARIGMNILLYAMNH